MNEFDVVVIGSGFGGAVASCRLSQAGFSVLLLERGRRYEANDFPALPEEDRLLPDLQRWSWHNQQGLWDLQDLEEIVSVQAAGYGGGSLIYANVHLRPPAGTFNRDWPSKFRGDALEPYFDLAAYMLDVAPIDQHPERPFVKTTELESAAAKLGRSVLRPPLAVSYADKINAFGEAQSGCNGCGKCCTGCPRRAKNSLDLNYLAVAENNGARVLTQCEVTRVVQEEDDPVRGARWRVDYIDHLGARSREAAAAAVFLCAGSIHSTRLLKTARLRPGNERLKERVGTAYFPNADAAGMVYDTAEEQFPSRGPAITTSTVQWNREGTSFFMIQDGGYPSELARMSGVFRAPLWAGRNRLCAGRAVPPGGRPKPPAPSPFPGVALVSPLDGALDAIQSGAFSGLASKQVQETWDAFLQELRRPLLLSAIVESTIEQGLRTSHARSWLRGLSFDHFLVQKLGGAARWLSEKLVGSSDELGCHALSGALRAGGCGRDEYAREVLGYDAGGGTRRTLLLAMGRDAARGALLYDPDRDRMIADLDLFHLVPGYTNQELVMRDIAERLGGELRVNPAWEFVGKPITVHSQGGCGMSNDPRRGVTRDDGQVHGCPGLYVLDGSVLCQSVGVNPSATILAIAECNVLEFIRKKKANPNWPAGEPEGPSRAGAEEYRKHQEGAVLWRRRAASWELRPPSADVAPNVPTRTQPLGLRFSETMQGYCAPVPSKRDPRRTDSEYRRLENLGCPDHPVILRLEASTPNLSLFFEDLRHPLDIVGTIELRLPGEATKSTFPVKGRLELMAARYKPYSLHGEGRRAQRRAAKSYTTLQSPRRSTERFMRYHLSFADDEWRLEGYKRLRQDPGLDAWRDTSALFTKIGVVRRTKTGEKMRLGQRGAIEVRAAGAVHVDLTGFLYRQLPSFEVTGTEDPARIQWALAKFGSFFFGALQRIYMPEVKTILDTLYRPVPAVQHEPSLGSSRSWR